MTTPNHEHPRFHRATGRLPAWAWHELHAAAREARGARAVLVVKEAQQTIVIMDMEDYNRLTTTPDTQEGAFS